MARLTNRLAEKLLAAEGRKSVRKKVRATAKVSRKAAKTGAIVGVLAAAAVVVHEIRKRRKLN